MSARPQDRPAAPPAVGPATAADQSAVARPPSPAIPPVVASGEGGTPALSGQAWRDAVKAATSKLHAAQRNRRGKRPGKPIVGVRAAQEPRGGER